MTHPKERRMQAAFLLDQDADLTTLPEELRSVIVPRKRRNGDKEIVVFVFPRGAVVEGPLAVQIASTGQGNPIDEECAVACGLTPEQLKRKQIDYQMDVKGINRPEDRELYRAGVITGYDEKTQDYLRGPNWDAYHTALGHTEGDDE